MANQQRELDAMERQRRALELRIGGVKYSTIADELKYKSASGAFAAVRNAMKKTLQEPADELRALELERLDALWFTFYPLAKRGDMRAFDKCLRIMERRAALLGLDAAKRTELTGADGGAVKTEVMITDESILRKLLPELAPGGKDGADQPVDAG